MLLYLLHFDRPVGGKIHYSGSCEDKELSIRMRRHQCGTGSKLTRRAHAAGVGFTLAMVKPIPDRNAEANWKKLKRWKQDCMCCRQMAGVLPMSPDVHYFGPIARNNLEGLCFEGSNASGSLPGHEKRRHP